MIKKALIFSVMVFASTAFADASKDIEEAEKARLSGEYQKAVDILLPLAESGNIEAQGNIYYSLSSLNKKEEAIKWLFKSAESGNADAQITLASVYHLGTAGIPKNYEESIKWKKKAAQQGNLNALWFLAMSYMDGTTGVPENKVLAYMCLNIATAGGHKRTGAMMNNIEQYMTAEEIKKAQKLSLEWKPGTPLPESSN